MSTLNYLDDSDWSIDIDDEPTRMWIPLTVAILGVLLLVGSWVYKRQCEPVPYIGVTAQCVFDSPVQSGDYVIPSQTVAGECHDTGVKAERR